MKRTNVDGVPFIEDVNLTKGDLVQFSEKSGLYKFKKEAEYVSELEDLDATVEAQFQVMSTVVTGEPISEEEAEYTHIIDGKKYNIKERVAKNLVLLNEHNEVMQVTDIQKGETKKSPVTVSVKRLPYTGLLVQYPVYYHNYDETYKDKKLYGVFTDLADAFIAVTKVRQNNKFGYM